MAREPKTEKGRRLAALAAKATASAEAGAETVDMLLQHKSFGDLAQSNLGQQAHLDKETADLLDEIDSAAEDTRTNPWVRRAWLTEQLLALWEMESPPARRAAATIMAATGKRLPKSDKPALPVLTAVGPQEFGKWRNKTVISRAFWKEGQLLGRGICALVPTTAEDQEAYAAMRQIRAKARTSLLQEMQGELLFSVRDAAWFALWLVNDARISDSANAEKLYENGEEGVLIDKKREKRYRYHPLSEDEIFLVPDDQFGRDFVATLATLDAFQEKFWANELDCEVEIGKIVAQAEPEAEISPDQFLGGKVPGFTIIQHESWKVSRESDETVKVLVLFERQRDGHWKWTMANPEGVNSLFGGKRLRFHNWTGVNIPGHLEALLNRGEQVLSVTIAPAMVEVSEFEEDTEDSAEPEVVEEVAN